LLLSYAFPRSRFALDETDKKIQIGKVDSQALQNQGHGNGTPQMLFGPLQSSIFKYRILPEYTLILNPMLFFLILIKIKLPNITR
jgi:hypothetical protein